MPGPDGTLWFTTSEYSSGPEFGSISTSGAINYIGWQGTYAEGIFSYFVMAPDGAVWFTANISNGIGRITSKGASSVYYLPSTLNGSAINWEPGGITVGPDGALWFTQTAGDKLGRATTAGVISEYDAPKSGGGITLGPDGALWYLAGDVIVRAAISTPPAPAAISSLNPSSATAGTSAFNLIVNGSGFVSGATVQ